MGSGAEKRVRGLLEAQLLLPSGLEETHTHEGGRHAGKLLRRPVCTPSRRASALLRSILDSGHAALRSLAPPSAQPAPLHAAGPLVHMKSSSKRSKLSRWRVCLCVCMHIHDELERESGGI